MYFLYNLYKDTCIQEYIKGKKIERITLKEHSNYHPVMPRE